MHRMEHWKPGSNNKGIDVTYLMITNVQAATYMYKVLNWNSYFSKQHTQGWTKQLHAFTLILHFSWKFWKLFRNITQKHKFYK